MKKIFLFSDIYSYIDDTILKYVNQADEVWHVGDIGDLYVTDTIKKLKPLRCVYGNIDDAQARLEFPLHNRFLCENVSVWITHIGGYPGKYNPAIREEMVLNLLKLFICGYLYILKVMFDKNNNHFIITIHNNGKGFQTEKLNKSKGFNLNRIRTRIKKYKNTLSIISKPNKNTSIKIKIPLPH